MLRVRQTLAVINPAAGGRVPALEQLEEHLGECAVVDPSRHDDLVGAIREAIASRRPDRVVASGGDGTVSAVVTAVDGAGIPIGIVPSGTANVFASEVGLPTAVDAACEVIDGARIETFDAIRFGDRRCVCRVGLGAFGDVGRQTRPQAKARVGTLAYAWSAAPLLANAPVRSYELEVDGKRVRLDASGIVVTNLASVGWGELRFGSRVSPRDGILDAFICHGRGLGENLEVLWDCLVEDLQASDQVSHLRVHETVRITVAESISVAADGEPLHGRQHELHVAPASVPIFVPR